MKSGRLFHKANADRHELAAHVRTLVDQAMKLQTNAERMGAVVASTDRPPSQISLDWTDQFSMRICDSRDLDKALKLSTGKNADSPAAAAFLRSLAEEPTERALSQPPLLEALDHLAENFPNFLEVVSFVRMRTALALLQPSSPLLLPPMLLDGPPGVGKTAFAQALAYALDVPLLTLQMSHATGPFDLAGLDPKYSNGGPGLLVRTVALGRAVDPLVLLDEIDKVPSDRTYDPLGPLYTLLEPSTAKNFIDDGIKLPLNMSHVRWLCTTNNVKLLNPAIASRCQIFEIAAPTLEQGRAITRKVYNALLGDHPWGKHFALKLSAEVTDLLARHTPRELTRALLNALGKAALEGRKSLSLADFPLPASEPRGPGFL